MGNIYYDFMFIFLLRFNLYGGESATQLVAIPLFYSELILKEKLFKETYLSRIPVDF